MKLHNYSIIFIIFLCLSCSDDDSTSQSPEVNFGEVRISAQVDFDGTSGRQVSANNLEINAFYINIKEIEFEYATSSRKVTSQTKSDDDDYLSFEDLPQPIKDYLSVNHPDDPFCKAEVEDDDDEVYKYEVELLSGLELYFRSDFTLYAQEQDDEPCNDENDPNDESASYGIDDEFELTGPFEINLGDGNTSTTILNVNIPVGIYEEVEFKMDRGENPNSFLYQKSIMFTGTLDGLPLTFYHTFEEDFELDYEDSGQNLVIDDTNNNEVIFNFDLNSVINTVDFSIANDGNNDGTIEISPVDTDGNNALANSIKSAIVEFAELLD